MGPGPPPGAASRSSTPTVRSIRQPVPASVAKLGMAALPPASAAKAAPVADIMATKQIKPCLDMFHPRSQRASRPIASRQIYLFCSRWNRALALSKPKEKGESQRQVCEKADSILSAENRQIMTLNGH